jgi:Kef-type K+ transport system membrane component KefB
MERLMPLLLDLSTPFTEPVIIFTLVLCIILISPILLNKLRIPAIVVMIVAGVTIGPHGFHLLERDGAIVLFGTVGLLYIMFLAGLEIEMNGFKKKCKIQCGFRTTHLCSPVYHRFCCL